MLARWLPGLLHLTVASHVIVAITVVTVTAFVLMIASGDDWNMIPDDFDIWERL